MAGAGFCPLLGQLGAALGAQSEKDRKKNGASLAGLQFSKPAKLFAIEYT